MIPKELLVTSSRQNRDSTACIWDPTTGNQLHVYKNGGFAAPKTLNLVGSDYLLSADEEKPLLHLWFLNSQTPIKKHLCILPERAQVLSVCPKSVFLAAGIGLKLYIWHVSSGKLFTVQKRNFQPISCLKWSSEGAHLALGGHDGMLVVYDLVSLVSLHQGYLAQKDIGQVEPLYTKQDHSMPILDLQIGDFSTKSRIATISTDQTCKIYNFITGEILLSLVYGENLTCVVFDAPCWNLYVAQGSGTIRAVSLREPPRNVEHHLNDDVNLFVGHEKRVNCLSLNYQGTLLASGGDDGLICVWEIKSRQIVRRIDQKSAITNVKFLLDFKNIFVQDLKPKIIFASLERDLSSSGDFVISEVHEDDDDLSDDEEVEGAGNQDLRGENLRLRAINLQLYQSAISKCFPALS